MCNKTIEVGTYYTRHQTIVPKSFFNREHKLITYCLCEMHAPFRDETEEEKRLASGELPKVEYVKPDVAEQPTALLPVTLAYRPKPRTTVLDRIVRLVKYA